MKKLIIVLFSALFITSCATGPLTSDDFVLEDGQGVVVADFSSNVSRNFMRRCHYTIFLRNINTGKRINFNIDQDDPNYIYIIDEGKYQIYSIIAGSTPESYDFLYPVEFDVKAGKVNYIGDFYLKRTVESRGPSVRLKRNNNIVRTLNKYYELFPSIQNYEVYVD